ncbi:hypothetical protein M758_6G064800 [Ceratodon purpureus]|uniref:Uncharacterized protein n=1 Tax=Ceratodon purpureus TaxID=3225 RepID=A0A8T0HI94_CERPU|nr:hypothetical protein KC19_6G068900 [Ceratodon purpureus]KAG0612945.1 hypothetical protein M758_6G064800 [Ceratodon purpureus]
MAGDVWRWCQVHQKWLQDVNVKVTPRGLQNDRGESASHSSFSPSSRSFSSNRPDCLERMARKPLGNPAASSRWQDDARIMDPVSPSPRYSAGKSKKGSFPLQESGVALRDPRDLGLGMQDYANARPVEGSTDVGNVWPQSRPNRPVRWLFQETPIQSNFLPAFVGGTFKV